MNNAGKMILVAVGLILFECGEVWGADWRFLGNNEWADSYYDADSITRPPSKVILRVQEKRVFTEKGVAEAVARSGFGEKYRDLSFVVAVSEFNCAEKQKRTLSLVWHSRNGKVLASDEGLPQQWDPIPSGSLSEAAYHRLCKAPGPEDEPGPEAGGNKQGDWK